MDGLFHRILVKRYGMPEVVSRWGFQAHQWNGLDEAKRCILYVGMRWADQDEHFTKAYEHLYGDAFGGYLLRQSVNIASLAGVDIYGLWRLDELRSLPAILQATMIDPEIHFFMDSANVWYYGHKNGDLYVYDSEFEELDRLGSIEEEIEKLLVQWEETIDDSR